MVAAPYTTIQNEDHNLTEYLLSSSDSVWYDIRAVWNAKAHVFICGQTNEQDGFRIIQGNNQPVINIYLYQLEDSRVFPGVGESSETLPNLATLRPPIGPPGLLSGIQEKRKQPWRVRCNSVQS